MVQGDVPVIFTVFHNEASFPWGRYFQMLLTFGICLLKTMNFFYPWAFAKKPVYNPRKIPLGECSPPVNVREMNIAKMVQ